MIKVSDKSGEDGEHSLNPALELAAKTGGRTSLPARHPTPTMGNVALEATGD